MDIIKVKSMMADYWMEKEKYNDDNDGKIFTDDYLCGLYDMLSYVEKLMDEEIEGMEEYYGENIEE